MWRRDARAAVRLEYSMKKPAADFSARAFDDFCDDAAMPVICPTCQIVRDIAGAAALLQDLDRRRALFGRRGASCGRKGLAGSDRRRCPRDCRRLLLCGGTAPCRASNPG